MTITEVYEIATPERYRSLRDLDRARRIYRRLRRDPGDLGGDLVFLMALAVAENEVGRGPGWIPEVQRRAAVFVREIEARRQT
jgi:hypothetical protein